MTKPKFFKEVDFSDLESELGEEVSSDFPKKEEVYPSVQSTKIKDVCTEIYNEVENMKFGVSRLRKGGLYIPKGTLPVLSALSSLKHTPSPERVKTVLELTKQDLGIEAYKQFKKWFEVVDPKIKEIKDE